MSSFRIEMESEPKQTQSFNLVNQQKQDIRDKHSNLKEKENDKERDKDMFEIPPEIRIGVGGNVDAGKSSFVGVVTRDILDNGRGYARSFVFRHKHEKETGRTSSTSQQYIRMPNKVIEFNDLAGHEKYYKCTAKQLATNFLDYVAVVINSGSGIQMMTREHISLAYSLRIPMFIIYTKVDSTPTNIYDINLEYIKTFYKNKMNLAVQVILSQDNTSQIASQICNKGAVTTVPVFPVSNVTGAGIEIVKKFLIELNKTIDYKDQETEQVNFLIHRTYHVQGIGLVVSGVMKSGIVKKNDILYLGPNSTGYVRDSNTNAIISAPSQNHGNSGNNGVAAENNFYKVTIKGIHNNFQESVDFLKAGYSGCFNIKAIGRTVIKRSMIRPGMRLLGDFQSVYQFQAKIKICNSSSTITKKYQPVVHCGGISQSVRIVAMDKEYLRSFDEGVITFQFMYRPEYIEVGNIFIMREGNLKALGKVINIDKGALIANE
jgi:GTPase